MKQHHSKLFIPIIVIVIALLGIGIFLSQKDKVEPTATLPSITNFEECVAAGFPVMESYPRQCAVNGVTYTEAMITISYPKPNDEIKSPLIIKGEARGGWFFEATFPVTLTNWDGLIIAEGYAQADGEWMTEDFVPFTATITFDKPTFNNRGFLILKKSNASGLPEHDASIEIPIYFEGVAPQTQ